MKIKTMLQLCAACLVFVMSTNSVSAATTYYYAYPVFGTAKYSGWNKYNPSYSPPTGGAAYETVDERPCSGTDYVYSATSTSMSSFVVTTTVSYASLGQVTAIDIVPCAATKLALTGKFKVFYILNGTDSALSSEYTVTSPVFAELATTTYSGLSIPAGSITSLEAAIRNQNGVLVKLGAIKVRLQVTTP